MLTILSLAGGRRATANSVSNDPLTRATAEVFSASLYLRSLRDRDETRLTPRLGLTEKLLKAVDELIEPSATRPSSSAHKIFLAHPA